MNQSNAFDELKKILLEEEQRESKRITDDLREELQSKINKLESDLNDPIIFSSKIEGSKKEIVDVLGPVMGAMIRKYVSSEIEKLNDSISKQKNKIFGIFSFNRRKAKVEHIQQPQIVEILLIAEDSGLLLGKYSTSELTDSDMIAGMFTAIKSFMEDAVHSSDQNVSLIEYNDFRIFLHNYGNYYFSVIFEGRNSQEFLGVLRKEIDQFADQYRSDFMHQNPNSESSEKLNDIMQSYFDESCARLAERLF